MSWLTLGFARRKCAVVPRLIDRQTQPRVIAGMHHRVSMTIRMFSQHTHTQHSLIDWEAADKGKTLVIVESPAKALTIQKFLDSDSYVVDCCVGHIFELDSSTKKKSGRENAPILDAIGLTTGSLGVDVYNNFSPRYVPVRKKKEVITRLKAKAQDCSRILLATDDDREGEAISWHLVELLQPSVPYKRAVFHEITQEAIVESFQHPRDINMNLVNSQETRRIVDRLVGFTVSPVLWRYIHGELSAGRVQSCGLNLIAERERKRWAFVGSHYFSIKGRFGSCISSDEAVTNALDAQLYEVNGQRVADESSFDGSTGKLPEGSKSFVIDNLFAERVMRSLVDDDNTVFSIKDIVSKSTSRRAPLPFITSTLQRASSSKLNMSPSATMATAQKLYEGGFITYMRTDSPILSAPAASLAHNTVKHLFGESFLKRVASVDKEGTKKEKISIKNAQDAHEAIRPATESNGRFLTPDETGLEGQQKALYSLIYKRTLGSVMKNAEYMARTYFISGSSAQVSDVKSLLFRSSSSSVTIPGYLAALDMSDDKKISHRLPSLEENEPIESYSVGQQVFLSTPRQSGNDSEDDEIASALALEDYDDALDISMNHNIDNTISSSKSSTTKETAFRDLIFGGLVGKQHITRPPHRFSTSSFIKELEKLGVGRPSTYAFVLATLSAGRGYIRIDKNALIPTVTGMIVDKFLCEHFRELTESDFTAKMEEALDQISNGELDKQSFLTDFYLGRNDDGFLHRVKGKFEQNAFDHVANRTLPVPYLDDLGELRISGRSAIFVRHESPDLKQIDNLFIESLQSIEPNTKSQTNTSSRRWKLPESMQLDMRDISLSSIEHVVNTEVSMEGANMGIDVDNNPVRIRSGLYGKYLEVGLRKDKTHKVYSLPKWIPATVTLEQVLEFASLPRVIGVHTDPLLESAHVIVDICGGQVSVGVEGYPLRVPISRDGTYPSEVSFDEALLLLPDASDILSSLTRLGVMNDIPVTIEKGRWGYYLRCGDIISRFPKISKDEVTIELAIECLNTFGKKIGSKKRSKKAKEEVAVARKEKRRLEKEEKKRIQQEKTEANTAKRAPGPFIVFCSQMRSEIVTANPGAEFGTIAKQLGKMWKELSDEEKATFGNRN